MFAKRPSQVGLFLDGNLTFFGVPTRLPHDKTI